MNMLGCYYEAIEEDYELVDKYYFITNIYAIRCLDNQPDIILQIYVKII